MFVLLVYVVEDPNCWAIIDCTEQPSNVNQPVFMYTIQITL